MKIILLILFSISIYAQPEFRFYDGPEHFRLSIITDPYASYKEGGLYIGGSLEYTGLVSIGANVKTFSALEDDYIALFGNIDLNFTSGYNHNIRYYLGGRLGAINRQSTNAFAGIHSGIDINLTKTMFIGGRLSYDYRSDQEFYDYPNHMQYNGYLRLGFKF